MCTLLLYLFDMDGYKCRLCLERLTINKIFCDSTIAKNINSCCKIRVIANDNLQKYICNLCHDKLDSIINFRIETEKNDKILRDDIASKIEEMRSSDIYREKIENDVPKFGFEVPILKEEASSKNNVIECLKNKSSYSKNPHLLSAPNIYVRKEIKCRLCLQHNHYLKIYCDPLVVEKIEICCNIKVDCDDNLPKYICGKCSARLDDIIDFINDCDYNDKFSRDRIGCDSSFSNLDESESENHNDVDTLPDSLIMPPPKTILTVKSRMIREPSIVKKQIDKDAKKSLRLNEINCELCGKIMKKPLLKNHMPEISWENKFECDVCSIGFFSKKCLRIHIRRHFGLLPPINNIRLVNQECLNNTE